MLNEKMFEKYNGIISIKSKTKHVYDERYYYICSVNTNYFCEYTYNIFKGKITTIIDYFKNESDLINKLDIALELNNIINKIEITNYKIYEIIKQVSPKYSYTEWLECVNRNNKLGRIVYNVNKNIPYDEIWKYNLNNDFNKEIKNEYDKLNKEIIELKNKLFNITNENNIIIDKELYTSYINNWTIKM